MPEAFLRPLRYQDIDRLAEVHVRSWQVGYQDLLPVDFLAGLDPAWRARQLRESWNHPDHAHVRSLIAEQAGEILGFVRYGPSQSSHRTGCTAVTAPVGSEVYALYVHPDHWGTGVGGRLLDAAVAELVSSGLTPVQVWILRGNTRAAEFYQRHGFVPDSATQSIQLDPDHDVAAIVKHLTLQDTPAAGS